MTQVGQLLAELLFVHFTAFVLPKCLAENARRNLENCQEENELGERDGTVPIKVDDSSYFVVMLLKKLFGRNVKLSMSVGG